MSYSDEKKSKEFKIIKKRKRTLRIYLFLLFKIIKKNNMNINLRNFFNKSEDLDTKYALKILMSLNELKNRIKEISNVMKLKENFKITEKFPGSFLIEKEG